MRKYYFKKGGRKVYSVPNTLEAITNKAQQYADEVGRGVIVFYEDLKNSSENWTHAKAAKKVYARNPAKKKTPKPRVWEVTWRDETDHTRIVKYHDKEKARALVMNLRKMGHKDAAMI